MNSISTTAPNPSSFLTEYQLSIWFHKLFYYIYNKYTYQDQSVYLLCLFLHKSWYIVYFKSSTHIICSTSFPWQLMCLTCFFVNYHMCIPKTNSATVCSVSFFNVWVFWLFPSSCYDLQYILSHAYVQVILQHIFQFIWRACYKKYTHP